MTDWTRYAKLSSNHWLHSTDEFLRAVQNAGFIINSAQTLYQGYSDLVIAQKLGRLVD